MEKEDDTETSAMDAFIKTLEGNQPKSYVADGKPVPDTASSILDVPKLS